MSLTSSQDGQVNPLSSNVKSRLFEPVPQHSTGPFAQLGPSDRRCTQFLLTLAILPSCIGQSVHDPKTKASQIKSGVTLERSPHQTWLGRTRLMPLSGPTPMQLLHSTFCTLGDQSALPQILSQKLQWTVAKFPITPDVCGAGLTAVG